MLAYIIIALAVTAAILKLVEVMLSEKQKQWLSLMSIRFWSWLDNVRKLSFLAGARKIAFLIVLAAAVAAIYEMHLVYGDYLKEEGVFAWVFVGVILIASLALGFWFMRLTLRATTIGGALLRSVGFFVLSILPTVLLWPLFIYLVYMKAYFPPDSIWAGLLFIVAGISLLLTFILVVFTLILILPVLVLFVIASFVATLELVMRRISEHSSGPILALSALVAGIAGVIKAVH